MKNETSGRMITISERILFQLAASHSLLSAAEYERNPQYNNEHFSARAEFALMDEIAKHDGSVYDRLMLQLQITKETNEK